MALLSCSAKLISRRAVVLLASLVIGVLAGVACADDPVPRSSVPPMTDCSVRPPVYIGCLWTQLDQARITYRDLRAANFVTSCNGARGGMSGLKSYDDMKDDYLVAAVQDTSPSETPQQLFTRLALGADGFRQFLGAHPAEATAGIQEALNELLAGQALIGNDDLVRGLRARFPGIVSQLEDPDQFTLLSRASERFQSGINAAVNEVRQRPDTLRAEGTANEDFKIFVENTARPLQSNGEVVENEYYRFNEVVYRNALACNAIGRRQFFFGNADDASGGGRAKAVRALKRAAMGTYLNSALLSALQTRKQFFDNNGFELKRQVRESEQTFQDVRSGFNPLKLLGDFVPRQPAESFLRSFKSAATTAKEDEGNYRNSSRQYDTDQTQLTQELNRQREQYLNQISEITGINTGSITLDYNDLQADTDQDAFFAAAEASLGDELSSGQLRALQLKIEDAGLAAAIAQEEIRKIPEKIRYEEERLGQVAQVVRSNGSRIGALQAAITRAGCCSVAISAGVQTENFSKVTFTSSITATFNPGVFSIANDQEEISLLQTEQQVAIEGINSAATIKNLLLEQVTAFLNFRRAAKGIDAAHAELRALRARLERTVRDYTAARQGLACAYFTNPAYRLQLDIAKENADRSFEDAMIQGYFAAKALEYEWAERFTNPVPRIGVGGAEPIGDSPTYAPFLRAESVFAVHSAGSAGAAAPTLLQFSTALSEWDKKMRQLRGNELQPEFTEVISLRKQILGWAGGDEALNRLLFANFIAKNRKPGRNPAKRDVYIPFSLGLADQLIFPAEPNLKMVKVSLNIKSRPGRFAAESPWSGQPFRVEMVMLDEAVVRTFFADVTSDPPQDDLYIIDLEEGRSLATSPFRGLVQASLDGLPVTVADNVQFANLSPAVTRWMMHIDMTNGQNTYLIPELLDDVELRITYKFGRPRVIDFPL